jgi:hypothetical protein
MKLMRASLVILTFVPPALFLSQGKPLLSGVPDLAVVRFPRLPRPARLANVVPQSPDATQFMVAPEFPVDLNPQSGATGDFNGDGKLDLAVNNANANTLSILLGNGDGTFQPKADYPTGSFPQEVLVSDFNGDQKADVAVLNKGDNTVGIFLGKGDGTFAAPVNYPTGPVPVAFVAADLNNDVKPDLAVSNSNGSGASGGPPSLSVLLNKGDGTFESKLDYPNVAGGSIAVGDFNGDGNPDLAAQGSLLLDILLSDGNGGLTLRATYQNDGIDVAAGDFNGDGKQDLVVAVYGGAPAVDVLLGNGDGTFQLAGTYDASAVPLQLAVGDFNGDGRLDLAVAEQGDQINVMMGGGDGTFSTGRRFGAGWGIERPIVADFNGDGKADLAVPNLVSNTVSILNGNGDGTFYARLGVELVGGQPGPIAIGDFNGDGKLDLAAPLSNCTGLDCSNDPVAILLGNGDGTFQPGVNYLLGGYRPSAIALGDFNHDGVLDLVAVNAFSGNIGVLLGKGDGTFQTALNYMVGGGPFSIAVADFNGDGNSDLAVANTASNTVSLLFGKGDGAFKPAVDLPLSSPPGGVSAGDFNGDGKTDLAITLPCPSQQCSNGSLAILLGKGDGTFGMPFNYTLTFGPRDLVIGDINRDGKLDIVVTTFCVDNTCSAGALSILLGNGDGTFQPPLNQNLDFNVESPVLADINQDGKLDLVIGNFPANTTTAGLLVGNGDGTFQAPQYYSAGDPTAVAVADVNGDGKLDLVATGGVLLNVGITDFSISSSSIAPNPLSAGDPASGVVQLVSQNGFDGNVALSCAVQPSVSLGPTCAMTPASANLPKAGSNKSTLSIQTTAKTTSMVSLETLVLTVFPMAAIALFGSMCGSRRRSQQRLRCLSFFRLCLLLFCLLALQVACGGSSSSHNGGGGTPLGTYTITVTGSSGSIQHTSKVTVQVD